MKKLTKTAVLILSALMLFGCADNSAQSSAGDTTPPAKNSVTESESSDKISDIKNSSASDNSGAENDEDLVKNIEGYQTFS